jgi:diguanylate cyclase (GGDEF)-like protein/putative nucleotidyltransferase with HDIG domain
MPDSKAAARFTERGRLYLAVVILSGIAAVTASLYDSVLNPLPVQWYMLAALTLVSGSATVTLPTVGASISVSETFVFASVLLFGPSAGTITVALDGLVISFWMAKRRPEWYRALFNMAAPAISIWLAANVLFAIAGVQPLFGHESPINLLIFPLGVFALLYFGLNSWLIALAVAFESRRSPYTIWRQNFLWLSLNYFSGASVALLLVAYSSDVDVRFIGVIVPLLLVLYLTFKTTMGRVEDANSHVQQLNRLYLSTIETLAMAIDAKDQVTHGHIRRVQRYAVGLAREVGVSDERLLKAIEAAALLHDMGKLAVPEYILNKPGKLTAAEFEKMKLHASVGADILAAIEFPYPVVPIVRHHHENWDGTGYPAGLKSTDIPIGARILSVVDCFDALISDRPYRPRLSDEEAIAILVQRRGTMYDPLIVDTFVRVHREIAPEPLSSRPNEEALNEIASSVQPQPMRPSFSEISASSDEMSTLYELARALAGHRSLPDAAEIIARHLRRLIPSSLIAFYIYDVNRDELVISHASGDGAALVRGLRISLGQRLSGWVAANRKTILNSDASLDLGDTARAPSLHLRSCISTPLLEQDELIGVLTLYSSVVNGFTEDHRRVIEVIARQIAHALKGSMLRESTVVPERMEHLPHLDQLQAFLSATDFRMDATDRSLTMVFVNIVNLSEILRVYGLDTGEQVLNYVSDRAGDALRGTDILFRYGAQQLVALLNDPDANSGRTVAARISDSVTQHPLVFNSTAVDIELAVTTVSAPQDGSSLTQLIDRAAHREPTSIRAVDQTRIH